jgi:ribosomal protein S18 acetylase RimI-like enzyme
MHPLDSPACTALTTHQAHLALISPLAQRFPPEMAVHGCISAPTLEAFQALARLAPQPAGLFFDETPQVPPQWTVQRHIQMIQMVLDPGVAPEVALPSEAEIVELTTADLPEMMRIYELTRPGRTICPQIQRLGPFIGVRQGGKLVAMGGLRIHVPGYREITTVGTDPQHTGRGYATALVCALVRRIRSGGEETFLHVRDDNTRAIQIYDRLGFKERKRFHFVSGVLNT